MNKFLAFTVLTAAEQAMIRQYRSPDNELSVVKQVPIDQAEYFRALVFLRQILINKPILFREDGGCGLS